MEKLNIKQVETYDRFILNKEKSNAFMLKKGKTLKGNYEDFIEISQKEYESLSRGESNNSYYETEDVSEICLVSEDFDIKKKAMLLTTEGIPDFNFSESLMTPFSDRVKKNNEDFLENANSEPVGINENISAIVKKIQLEAKKMIPSKFAVKAESSKHISRMFNLSGKRKDKLILTKKSLSTLQTALDKEKEIIREQIKVITGKIEEYGNNIIDYGGVRENIQDIIEQRETYIKAIPEGEKTPEQHEVIENFIKESEKIIVLLLDVNALISSTEQRKKMFEFNRGAFEEVLINVRRVDNFLMPAMIGEYEAYVVNQNLSNSNNVKDAVTSAINEATNRNTQQMKSNISKAYEKHNDPVQSIESLLKRQAELLSVSLEIENAAKNSRARNEKYAESLNLINQSAVEMRENKGDSSIESHLNYIRNLKNNS